MDVMWKEFKSFALKGNVLDLAIGVIIGGAFGKIVASLVSDIIMPSVGLLLGGRNFSNMFVLLKKAPVGSVINTIEDAKNLNLPTLNYGVFMTQVIDFIIIAFSIFIIIKIITSVKSVTSKTIRAKNGVPAPEPAPPPTTKECPFCRSVIHLEASRCPHCTSEQSQKGIL
jgi:large conductance mechanosensitive channel